MFGLFGIGNFGNEASLAAAVVATRRALTKARVTTISANPVRVEAEHGIPGVWIDPSGRLGHLVTGGRLRRLVLRPLLEVARLVLAVRHLRRIDLVIVPGTGVLDDYGQRPDQFPLSVARWAAAARVARTRLVYLGIGAGPIAHPVSRRLMRFGASQAAFISYRDEGSRRFMASIGRDTASDEVWPDLVFAQERDLGGLPRDDRPFTVALGVMNYKGWSGTSDEAHARYIARMTDLGAALRAARYALQFVIGEDSDLQAARIVAKRLGEPEATVVHAVDLEDVCATLETADVLVSSRYHNLIAALLTGVPAVSLSYADKNDQLLGAFGLGEFCHGIETFDIDRVLAQLDTIRRHHAALADGIRRRVTETRQEVRELLDRELLGLSD
jgi:polysaccharide pyruvyl transferase WcaK-like protein